MRPPGEIRQQALAVAWDLAQQRRGQPIPGVTLHDLQRHLVPQGISRQAVRHTWQNLRRHGVLVPLPGVKVRAEGVCRPMLACVPAGPAQRVEAPGAELARCMGGWRR